MTTAQTLFNEVCTRLVPLILTKGIEREAYDGPMSYIAFPVNDEFSLNEEDNGLDVNASDGTYGIICTCNIMWGEYNLDIRYSANDYTLFFEKGARQSAQAEGFATLDALFERVSRAF